MQRFEGTTNYVATDDLKVAVNAAVMLRRPLLQRQLHLRPHLQQCLLLRLLDPP